MCLRAAIDDWAKELPEGLRLHGQAIASDPDQDETERPKLEGVLKAIKKLRLLSSVQ